MNEEGIVGERKTNTQTQRKISNVLFSSQSNQHTLTLTESSERFLNENYFGHHTEKYFNQQRTK